MLKSKWSLMMLAAALFALTACSDRKDPDENATHEGATTDEINPGGGTVGDTSAYPDNTDAMGADTGSGM